MEENRNEVFENNNEQQIHVQPEIGGVAEAMPVQKKKNVAIIIFQIIAALIYLGVTVYLTVLLIDVLNTPPPQDGQIDGKGIAFAAYLIITIIFGGIGYIIDIIISIVGLVVSSNQRKKGCCGVGTIIYFVAFVLLPIITFIVLIVLPRILVGN